MEKGDCKRSFEDAVKELNLKMIKKVLKQEKPPKHKITNALFTVVNQYNFDDTALLKQLICVLVDNGANINVQNDCDETILIMCFLRRIQIAEFLINLGADVNISNQSLDNPFMLACWLDNIKIMKKLTLITENINQQSKYGWTALISASYEGHIKIVDYLLDIGADVKYKTNDNDNALVLAAWKGHIDIVKLLVEKGKLSVNIEGEDGLTALEWAKYYNRNECVTYLTDEVTKSKSITKTALMKIINVDICNIITEFLDFRV